MALAIRMILYLVLGGLGTVSWLTFDQVAGTFTIQIDGFAQAVVAYAGFVATFVWSRISKRRGGAT